MFMANDIVNQIFNLYVQILYGSLPNNELRIICPMKGRTQFFKSGPFLKKTEFEISKFKFQNGPKPKKIIFVVYFDRNGSVGAKHSPKCENITADSKPCNR